MKILCTGDSTYGLCKALSEQELEITFICEKDYLFNQGEFVRTVEKESLKFDIFLNCAKLSNFLQVKVLYDVYYLWGQMNKSGRIITIGSDIIHHPRPTIYCLEKQALKAMHDMLYQKNPKIDMTLVNPGKLGEDHISYDDMARFIKFIVDNRNIREITIS